MNRLILFFIVFVSCSPVVVQQDDTVVLDKGQPMSWAWVYPSRTNPERFEMVWLDSCKVPLDTLPVHEWYDEGSVYKIKMLPQGFYQDGVYYVYVLAFKNDQYRASKDTVRFMVRDHEWKSPEIPESQDEKLNKLGW